MLRMTTARDKNIDSQFRLCKHSSFSSCDDVFTGKPPCSYKNFHTASTFQVPEQFKLRTPPGKISVSHTVSSLLVSVCYGINSLQFIRFRQFHCSGRKPLNTSDTTKQIFQALEYPLYRGLNY